MGAISRFDAREPIAFGPMIEPVARELWGEPNKRMSKASELRWGNQGARIVYPDTGAFKDTEADCGGGTLDLIQHVQGVDRAGAMAWLAERDFIPGGSSAARPTLKMPPARHAVRLDRDQRIVATFEFRRGEELLYRKHRIEPGRDGRAKFFAYDRPGTNGHWIAGQGNRKVPYRADLIKDADLIVMAEGEAKADRLAEWGYAATSLKDWDDAFGKYVAGKRVVILPDNDETGGRLASKTALQVQAADGVALVLNLPRLPDKGDVLDWDGDAAEIAALINALPFPKPPMLQLLDPAAWASKPTPTRTWALYEMILVGQVTYLTGAGATGKSLFGQQLATSIAMNIPFLGLDVSGGVALYLTCEDDPDELHRRQKSICEALHVPLTALSGRLHLASLAGAIGNELATFDAQGRMEIAPAWQRLRETVLATRATFIVLDNVAHLFAGNENIRNQVAAFLSLLNGLAAETSAAILLIGHPNKAGDSYSGSTAWENQVRSRLFLDRPKDADGSVLDPDARVLSRGKANYSRNGDALAFRWHQWAFVLEDALPVDQRAEIAAAIAASSDNAAFLACLAARADQGEGRHVGPAPGPNYAPSQFAGMREAKGLGRDRLKAAMERLFAIGEVETHTYRNTAKGRDVTIIRAVPRTPNAHPERLPNTAPEHPRTVLPNDPPHTPYTYGNRGGASEGPPPLRQDDADVPMVQSDGPILAPGEQPAPGWLS